MNKPKKNPHARALALSRKPHQRKGGRKPSCGHIKIDPQCPLCVNRDRVRKSRERAKAGE